MLASNLEYHCKKSIHTHTQQESQNEKKSEEWQALQCTKRIKSISETFCLMFNINKKKKCVQKLKGNLRCSCNIVIYRRRCVCLSVSMETLAKEKKKTFLISYHQCQKNGAWTASSCIWMRHRVSICCLCKTRKRTIEKELRLYHVDCHDHSFSLSLSHINSMLKFIVSAEFCTFQRI